jgi:hypothetical protein
VMIMVMVMVMVMMMVMLSNTRSKGMHRVPPCNYLASRIDQRSAVAPVLNVCSFIVVLTSCYRHHIMCRSRWGPLQLHRMHCLFSVERLFDQLEPRDVMLLLYHLVSAHSTSVERNQWNV